MASAYPNRAVKFNSMISRLFLLLILPVRITIACYTSIFVLGDSLSDVGNRVLLSNGNENLHMARPPYGETFFHHPTGRCSDGRLIIDFIAEYYGLAYMPSSASVMMNGTSIEGGVNFAVAGAAAIDSAYFEERGIVISNTNYSLRVQMSWLNEVLPFFCSTPLEYREKFKSSLFVLGPFGSNDYCNALDNGRGTKEIRSYVPVVIEVVITALNDLIKRGASTIMVPGTSPDGCLASILTDYGSGNMEDYDLDTGYLIWMNELNEYHNQLLQQKLNTIRDRNSGVVIIYADFYNATMQLYRSPKDYGFMQSLVTCCGVGGAYNFNDNVRCGDILVKSCHKRWRYIEWDGYHTTEKVNKLIFMTLLDGTYTSPPMNTLCALSLKVTYYN